MVGLFVDCGWLDCLWTVCVDCLWTVGVWTVCGLWACGLFVDCGCVDCGCVDCLWTVGGWTVCGLWVCGLFVDCGWLDWWLTDNADMIRDPVLDASMGEMTGDVNGVTGVLEMMSKRNREIFKLPAYMLYITRAFTTLEGIGLSVDKNYAILNECYPYLAKRLGDVHSCGSCTYLEHHRTSFLAAEV